MAIASLSSNRPFIYGTFGLRMALSIRVGKANPDIAIEILREFSALELIGRVYVTGPIGQWLKLSPSELSEYPWYASYRKGSPQPFIMQSGEMWKVLFIREESDVEGSYVAIALKSNRKS